MRLINIGFGNLVSSERLLTIVGPDSAPIKRMIQEARDRAMLIDASYGRKTRAVLLMDTDHVILSAIPPETIARRLADPSAGMSQGRIIIVSGPSGVGKGTILRTVMQQHESLHYSVSATSRPMRPEDREGVSYYFVSRERFEEMIAAGELLEHACYAGNYYGTPLRPVEEALARGESVVLEIDVQGALQVMQRRPDAISVFIAPPSYAELKRRLAGRGDTPPDIAARRLHIALEECRQAKHYQYTIINDSVGHAVQELEAVLTAEACRTSYRPLNLKEED